MLVHWGKKNFFGGGGGGELERLGGGGKLERLGGGEVGTFGGGGKLERLGGGKLERLGGGKLERLGGGGGSFPPLDRTLPAVELFPHYRCHPERSISLQNTRLTLRVYLCRCSEGSENTKGLRACSRAADKDSSLIGHLAVIIFDPPRVYCLCLSGQITWLTGQGAVLSGNCPVTDCYQQPCAAANGCLESVERNSGME